MGMIYPKYKPFRSTTLSAAECNNRLVHLEDFHKKCSKCCDTIFVKIFQMNQPVVTLGSREDQFVVSIFRDSHEGRVGHWVCHKVSLNETDMGL